MEGARARAAAALFVLVASLACCAGAPVNEQTALDIYEGSGSKDGCYYNFQHYGEGDRIMTNEPCLNCTCHNRMLMCYLRVCPFTKPIGQDCTVEKRGDQCCPVITCPDVHVDLLTSTSTTSPAEYGSSDVGHLEKYGCSIGGKFFSEGSKVPSTPNKPCELCYCIRNMTACVMQECTLHVDGCTPVYLRDVCCPVRYSCDHPEDGIPMLDDMTTTVRPTPGFLLTTTSMPGVTQDCVHQDEVFADGALIRTEKACEHCYCMKGDIVCVVQECGTPMENEGKNCTSMPPREGQCCPDTYICEGDTMIDDTTSDLLTTYIPTQAPTPKLDFEGSGIEGTNIPYSPHVITTPALAEEEKEGSGFDSGETVSTEGPIEESSGSTHTKPFEEFDENNRNKLDITTETEFEISSTTSADVSIPEVQATTTPSQMTEISANPTEKPSILTTEDTEDIPTTPILTVTDHSIDSTRDDETSTLIPSTEDITATPDEYITEKLDKQTTEPSYDQSTEKAGEPSILTTEDTEDISTTPILTVTEDAIDSTREDETSTRIPSSEDITAKPDEYVTENLAKQTKEPSYDQSTEKVEEQTTVTVEEKPTENVYDQSSTETSVYHSSSLSPEILSTEKPLDDSLENLDKPITEKLDETSTDKTIEYTTNDISTQTIDEMTTVPPYERSTEIVDMHVTEVIDDKYTKTEHELSTVTIPVSPAQSPEIDLSLPQEHGITEKPEAIDTQSTTLLDEGQYITTVANGPELTFTSDQGVSSTEVPVQEVSEELTTNESIEIFDTPTTTNVPHIESETSEPLGETGTKTSIEESSQVTTSDHTENIDDQFNTTPSYVSREPDEPETDNKSTQTIATKESTQTSEEMEHTTKVYPSDSYTTVPQSTNTDINEAVHYSTESTNAISESDESQSTTESSELKATKSNVYGEEITTLGPSASDITTDTTETSIFEQEKTENPNNVVDDIPSEPKISTVIPDEIQETTHSATEYIPSDVTLSPTSIESSSKHSTEPTQPLEETVEKDMDEVSYGTTEKQVDDLDKSTVYSTESDSAVSSTTETLEKGSSTSEPKYESETIQPTVISDGDKVTSVPDQSENEIDEEEQGLGHILPHIPGEGDCLVDGETYTNDSFVPSPNKCQIACKCFSSIVKCDPIQCSPPPDNMINCQPIYDAKESCCPTYVCDHAKETTPPESHNQMIDITTTVISSLDKETTTIRPAISEIPQSQCDSENCQSNEEIIVPVIVPECTSESCGPLPGQSAVPNRASDEGAPSEEVHPQTPNCKSGGCTQEPSVLPDQVYIDVPVIPVVVGTTDECTHGSCTPTRKNSDEEPHLIPSKPVTDIPAATCSGEGCPQISDECKDGNCKEHDKKPDATYCTGDKCDTPQILLPEDKLNEECKNGNCESAVTAPTESHPPEDAQCTGDSCGVSQTVPLPSLEKGECQGSSCITPTQISPETQPSEIPCEGECGEKPTVIEPVNQTDATISCTGNACGVNVVQDKPATEQCSGVECGKPDIKSPEATCVDDNCGIPEPVPVIPDINLSETCKNGDCRRTDSAHPGLEIPVNIQCSGDECEIKPTEDKDIVEGCTSGDCKPVVSDIPDIQSQPNGSCIGELCITPQTGGTAEIITSENCKGGDCQLPVVPESITELTTLSVEKTTEKSLIEPMGEDKLKPEIDFIHTTPDSNDITTRIASDATTSIPMHETIKYNENEIDRVTKLDITTEIYRPEHETSTQFIEKETEAEIGYTETEHPTTEIALSASLDETNNEIPADNVDDKSTNTVSPETTQSDKEHTEKELDESYMSTSPTTSPSYSSDQYATPSGSDQEPTATSETEKNEQQTEQTLLSTSEQEPTEEAPTTTKINIIESESPIPDKPHVSEMTTEISKVDKTTPQSETLEYTKSETDITEGLIATSSAEPEEGTIQETTTAYYVELEEHLQETISPLKPVYEESSSLPEQQTTTAYSTLKDKEEPEIHSHTLDTETTNASLEPEVFTIANVPEKELELNAVTSEHTEITPSIGTIIPEIVVKEADVLATTEENIVPNLTTEQEVFTEKSSDLTTPNMILTETVSPHVSELEKESTLVPEITEKTKLEAVTSVDETTTSYKPEIGKVTTEGEPNIQPSTLVVTDITTIKPSLSDSEDEDSIPTQFYVSSTINPELPSGEIAQDHQEEMSTTSAGAGTEKIPTSTENIKLEENTSTVEPTVVTEEMLTVTSPATNVAEDAVTKQTSGPITEIPEASHHTSDDDLGGTSIPDILRDNDTDKTTSIPETYTTESPIVEPIDKLSSEVPVTEIPMAEHTEKSEIPVTEIPTDLKHKETELPVKVSEIGYTSTSQTPDIADKFNQDDLQGITGRPDFINEIPEHDQPTEDKFTTVSVTSIDSQTEFSTNIPDLTLTPEQATNKGEVFETVETSTAAPKPADSTPPEEEASQQDITLSTSHAEDSTSHNIEPSTSHPPLAEDITKIIEGQTTVLPHKETIEEERTTSIEPDVTDVPTYIDVNEPQRGVELPTTVSSAPTIQSDITEEYIVTSVAGPELSTPQPIDSSQFITTEQQATELYEPSITPTPETQSPATESVTMPSEYEHEPTKHDISDKELTTIAEGITQSLPVTPTPEEVFEGPGATTAKDEINHEDESIYTTNVANITEKPTISSDAQPSVDLESETPQFSEEDKIQSTPLPLPEEDKKQTSSEGLQAVHPSTVTLPSPGEDVDHQSPEPFPAPGYGAGEQDYEEEDQAFGPGTCRYGGKVYVSAQQIPRDDPCDFCFCFRSDIICLQQSCPPPIHGCHEEPISGFCCPRYECPVSMATTLNVTTTTTTTTTTLPPHFPSHAYKGAAQRRGCHIKGQSYHVGEVVRSSSGPCLHCTCGGDGQMKCDPKVCTPEPMLRQMIAAAVSTKRRR